MRHLLPSGLYRRLRPLTESTSFKRVTGSELTLHTVGREFHPAPKMHCRGSNGCCRNWFSGFGEAFLKAWSPPHPSEYANHTPSQGGHQPVDAFLAHELQEVPIGLTARQADPFLAFHAPATLVQPVMNERRCNRQAVRRNHRPQRTRYRGQIEPETGRNPNRPGTQFRFEVHQERPASGFGIEGNSRTRHGLRFFLKTTFAPNLRRVLYSGRFNTP